MAIRVTPPCSLPTSAYDYSNALMGVRAVPRPAPPQIGNNLFALSDWTGSNYNPVAGVGVDTGLSWQNWWVPPCATDWLQYQYGMDTSVLGT